MGIEKGKGLRWDKGKTPIEFVPLHLINGAARVFKQVTEREVDSYPMWNWASGMDWSKPYACLLRHMTAWYCGEDLDPETGENHLHHAMCNLLMLIHYLDTYPNGDDRPKDFFKQGGLDDRP